MDLGIGHFAMFGPPWHWLGWDHTAYSHLSLMDLYVHTKFHSNQKTSCGRIDTEIGLIRSIRSQLGGVNL